MKHAIAAWFLLVLAGCVSYDGTGLRPGAGSEEIRAAMGEPGTIWREENGGATWEYPRAPEGRHTFMVRIGADGRLREIRQVLNAETFAHIRVGSMKQDEVRRLLGAPYQESAFPRMKERVWDYRYLDPLNSFNTTLHIYFDEQGVVKRTGSTIDDSRYINSGPGLN